MKPAVSIIAPTRGRVELLRKMLDSLTATARGQVEVVLRCDRDDPETVNYLRTRSHPFIVGSRLKGYATLATLVNEAVRLSTADLVMVVNDDAEFLTEGWDVKLVEAAAKYPDGVFDLGVTTVLNDGNFVFPCTSRRVIDAIGIHHESLIYSDIWLRDVMLPFGRAVRVPEVTVRHNWNGMSDDQRQALGAHDQAVYERCVDEARQEIRRLLEGA